jgi:hypothetical protein
MELEIGKLDFNNQVGTDNLVLEITDAHQKTVWTGLLQDDGNSSNDKQPSEVKPFYYTVPNLDDGIYFITIYRRHIGSKRKADAGIEYIKINSNMLMGYGQTLFYKAQTIYAQAGFEQSLTIQSSSKGSDETEEDSTENTADETTTTGLNHQILPSNKLTTLRIPKPLSLISGVTYSFSDDNIISFEQYMPGNDFIITDDLRGDWFRLLSLTTDYR